jgi:hypothetical protein
VQDSQDGHIAAGYPKIGDVWKAAGKLATHAVDDLGI